MFALTSLFFAVCCKKDFLCDVFSKQMFIFVAEFANPSRLHLLFGVDVSYSDLQVSEGYRIICLIEI